MSSAFFTSANVGSTYDVPTGQSSIPVSPTSPIHLALSDGTVQNVFDTKTSALMLMHTMRGIRSWQCYASEDVVCVFVGYAKCLAMQTSLVNQKLLHQFCPLYMGGLVRWAHRNTSLVLDTGDALRSVRSPVPGRLVSNNDLAPWNIQVVDWNFPNSQLEDATPIDYVYSTM